MAKPWRLLARMGWDRSENVPGADNQQERPARYPLGNPQRPYARLAERNRREEMVRPAWRHAEAGRNDRPTPMSEANSGE